MDKYEELITIFSDVLKKSEDYHIANIYQLGYVSVIGLHDKEEKQNISMQIDEIFYSPEEMADSLLKNWRWQWFYENRSRLECKDYDDIENLDHDIPDILQEGYERRIQELKDKTAMVLQGSI